MNDYYAKDIGKKIRAGYRQKQREGIVITPPFGYWKDRNTNQVLVQPEDVYKRQALYICHFKSSGTGAISSAGVFASGFGGMGGYKFRYQDVYKRQAPARSTTWKPSLQAATA